MKVTSAMPLAHYRIDLTFDDATRGTVDLSHLVGRGVFALWRDVDAFRHVKIGSAGELVWSDQVDLCADALYLEVTGKGPQDVFPALRLEPTDA